jgi:hypothetical protein
MDIMNQNPCGEIPCGVLEAPIKKKPEVSVDAESYVKEHFPIKKGESSVKYCHVGNDNFRVNFYTKKNPKEAFSDCYISRSYFVVLTKTGNNWEHEVL